MKHLCPAIATAGAVFVATRLVVQVVLASVGSGWSGLLLGSIALAVAFAVVVLCVYVPTFGAVRRVVGIDRNGGLTLGALLSPVAFVALLGVLSDGDALSPTVLVGFWRRVPSEFVGGYLPTLVASASFGLVYGTATSRENAIRA